jgi:hypothetical protein
LIRIVRIFDERLFSVQYGGDEKNELRRCLDAWNDATYIFQFLKANRKDLKNRDIFTASEQISDDAAELERQLDAFGSIRGNDFDGMFVPLDNNEYRPALLSKRKKRSGFLRLYAIKIGQNCFLITGGAIKLTQTMKEREHTAQELQKLDKVRDMLRHHDISDTESFFEWINET